MDMNRLRIDTTKLESNEGAAFFGRPLSCRVGGEKLEVANFKGALSPETKDGKTMEPLESLKVKKIQIDSTAKQQPAKHLEVIERAPPGPAITKVNSQNPNFEFFQMCLLSFKLNNQDLDEILELDQQALFTKCTVEHKKPFQDFQEWISKEVYKIRFKK